KLCNIPRVSRDDTANRIPKKKRTLGVSIRRSVCATEYCLWVSTSSFLWMISVTNHKMDKANNMPIKGGKCVKLLKIGTNKSSKTPSIKINLLSFRCDGTICSESGLSASLNTLES